MSKRQAQAAVARGLPWNTGASAPRERKSTPATARRRIQSLAPSCALVLLVAGFSLASPHFATFDNLRTIIEVSAIPAMLAAGLSFVLILGSIDLSVEGIAAAVSMTLSLLVSNSVNQHQLGIAGIGIAMLVGIAFGVLNGTVYVVARIPSLIVTLATWFIGLGIGTLLFPHRLPQIRDTFVQTLALGRWLGFTPAVYTAAMVLVVGHVVLRYSQFGRGVYAIGGDEALARASGLPVNRYKIFAYAISGACAAASSIFLTAQLGYGQANTGDGMLFPAISAAVIGGTLLSGGRGGVMHTAIGVLILSVLGNGMVQLGIDPYVRQIVEGAVIIGAVVACTWFQRNKLEVAK